MERIDFSVSMCVYGKDNPEYFDYAIETVINQTYPPTEIVLTIDGPIPDSIESVVKKYKETLPSMGIKFKAIRLKKNMGHGKARRICFENCTYPYIALMDSDDISKSDRFEKEIKLFRKDRDLAVVGSHVSEFFGDPQNIQTKRVVELTDKKIKTDLKYRCPINQPTVMFKKEAVATVGGYVDWYCNEDYYLWIRLALAGYKFANIDDCLVNMRMDENSYQRRGGKKYFLSEAKLQLYMLKKGIISVPVFLLNLCKRFVVQILLPNKIREFVFKTFARKKQRGQLK